MPTVLIADYVHPLLISGLQQRGYHVLYIPEIERGQVLDWIGECTGIVINTKTVADAELITRAVHMQWIARLGSGLDTIDLAAAQQRNIRVISTPQANANAVAEHVFGMLLCLLRHIARADQEVRDGQWHREYHRGSELQDKCVGVIGFGNTGSAFAAKFQGWQVKVVAYDKYKSGYAEDLAFVEESSLERVLHEADIISLHVPLTDETRHMVNHSFLARCKEGAIIVNSSRGKVVDTDALLEALADGTIGGACLDVQENESPVSFGPQEQSRHATLAAMPNVVLTPHIAGWTFESKRRIAQAILSAVPVYAAGEDHSDVRATSK